MEALHASIANELQELIRHEAEPSALLGLETTSEVKWYHNLTLTVENGTLTGL